MINHSTKSNLLSPDDIEQEKDYDDMDYEDNKNKYDKNPLKIIEKIHWKKSLRKILNQMIEVNSLIK